MSRIALTLWFTIATLFGPGVCCCSFGGSHKPAIASTPDNQAALAPQPVKSCCRQESPPCGDNGKQAPERGKSCPCEHGKQMKSLPVSGPGTSELSTQLKLLTECHFDFFSPIGFDAVNPASVSANQSRFVSRLAGRDLLAAYSLLRC